MDSLIFLGQLSLGIPLGLAAIGSSLGIAAVGQAAAGAWGKEAKAGKPLNFSYLMLTGMPLSQTIYAFVLMLIGLKGNIISETVPILASHPGTLLGIAIACGMAELYSAWMQGVIGASAVRALSEGEGQGLTFMIIAMGITETVGLFGFVFLFLMLP